MLGRMVGEALATRSPQSLVEPQLAELTRDADAFVLKEPASVGGAGLGDRAAGLALARLVERGDEAEPAGELAGTLEALPVADVERRSSRAAFRAASLSIAARQST